MSLVPRRRPAARRPTRRGTSPEPSTSTLTTDLSAIGPDAADRRTPSPAGRRTRSRQVFARAGIGPESFVLAVDDGTGWAARCWWLLRHLGHDAAGTFDLRGYARAR